jgi:hypothetical protein
MPMVFPTSPTVGQVFSSGGRSWVWNGTTWDSPSSATAALSGLTLVKSQAIGTDVGSIVVSDVFSADYENYKFLLNTNIGSAANIGSSFILGSTTSGYFGARNLVTFGATQTLLGQNNLTSLALGNVAANGGSFVYDIITPFLETRTSIQGTNINRINSTSGYFTSAGGFQNSNTSFTSFTLAFGSNTITGGSIEVYGYRKA